VCGVFGFGLWFFVVFCWVGVVCFLGFFVLFRGFVWVEVFFFCFIVDGVGEDVLGVVYFRWLFMYLGWGWVVLLRLVFLWVFLIVDEHAC